MSRERERKRETTAHQRGRGVWDADDGCLTVALRTTAAAAPILSHRGVRGFQFITRLFLVSPLLDVQLRVLVRTRL